MWPDSDTDVIKEINVLAGSALAICNPLCHYTKLPQGRRRWMSPAATRCCNQSELQITSRIEERPRAESRSSDATLILHWQSGVRIEATFEGTCDELFASVSRTEVVKTPTPHKANMTRGEGKKK